MGLHDAVDLAGDDAFEAPFDLPGCLAFGGASCGIGLGGGLESEASQCDGVQCAVEPVAYCGAAAGRDGRGAGDCREGGFVADAVAM